MMHSLFVESWKLGQRLKFCGTYFPTRLVEFYTATAVHSNCSRNISIHSEKISLLSSKGNKISGICDYPYHLSGNYGSPQQINMVMVYNVQSRLRFDQELLKLEDPSSSLYGLR